MEISVKTKTSLPLCCMASSPYFCDAAAVDIEVNWRIISQTIVGGIGIICCPSWLGGRKTIKERFRKCIARS